MVPGVGRQLSPAQPCILPATSPACALERGWERLLQLLESDLKVSVFPRKKTGRSTHLGRNSQAPKPSLCQTSPGGLGQGCSQLSWEGLWQREPAA